MKELIDWQTFYEIVGSSAGALIGLQLVLISLIARLPLGQEELEVQQRLLHPHGGAFHRWHPAARRRW